MVCILLMVVLLLWLGGVSSKVDKFIYDYNF